MPRTREREVRQPPRPAAPGADAARCLARVRQLCLQARDELRGLSERLAQALDGHREGSDG